MKKITLLLAFIGMITLQGCSDNDTDTDTISEVFEYTQVNFTSNNGYSQLLTYPHQIYTSDMVLVYRLSGQFQGEDIWKPLPETYFFDDGTLDLRYDFDFTTYDTELHMEGFDLANVSANYSLNQVFRVVIVPGYFGKKSNVDLKDYNAVVKAFHIDESKIIKVQ
ncbi:anti-DarT factor AdfA family protein [Flavobacterium sp. XGLA_31]|uniref:anti-DarT factor AdfA family protein n=1 Tax=Flavobacterium sp. XGLA_31 TaxID=3447666 RepID=UPI003F3B6259